jgi:hypothetical protein
LLHPGSSSAARASAATHTGAMAGDYQVMRTKVRQAGVLMVSTLEELIGRHGNPGAVPHPSARRHRGVYRIGILQSIDTRPCEELGAAASAGRRHA